MKKKSFICSFCGNKNKDYFYFRKKEMYCRKCISFINPRSVQDVKTTNKYHRYYLNYSLTDEQQKASIFVLENIKEKKNCAINAVCGAGKTEIIYDTISYCLYNNFKIGIAIPRKDVVIELTNRIKNDFPDNIITPVYGGNNKVLTGDLIILTTHQTHRYDNYFDVLIIDEVDAFPYKDNDLLQHFTKKSCRGNFVYLSATMPINIVEDKNIEKYYLNKRYHGYDLPVPKFNQVYFVKRELNKLLNKYKNKIVFVYFPTIALLNEIANKIKKEKIIVHSKIQCKNETIEKIKKMNKGIVFTTSILERGITVEDVQVIVYNADHIIFDKDTLIQIAGRVGRKKDFPTGDVIFLSKNITKDMRACRKQIVIYNE